MPQSCLFGPVCLPGPGPVPACLLSPADMVMITVPVDQRALGGKGMHLFDFLIKEKRMQDGVGLGNMTGEQGETSAWFSSRITAYLLITSVS